MNINPGTNKDAGQRIAIMRRYYYLSQEQVAEAMGMSVREYRRLENGDIVIYAHRVAQLVYGYGFDPTYIFLGKVSADLYINKALEVWPADTADALYDNHIYLLNDLKDNYSELDQKYKEMIRSGVLGLIIYGLEHFRDPVLREVEDFNFFTQNMLDNTPDRIRKGKSPLPEDPLNIEFTRYFDDLIFTDARKEINKGFQHSCYGKDCTY